MELVPPSGGPRASASTDEGDAGHPRRATWDDIAAAAAVRGAKAFGPRALLRVIGDFLRRRMPSLSDQIVRAHIHEFDRGLLKSR